MAGRQTGSVRRQRGSIITWPSPLTSERCNRSWRASRRRRLNAHGGGTSMATSEKTLRVLVVDDNRDGADALGLLVEELGNQVHVTYGGAKALEVATTFRPDLMLVDLAMPDMDGCGLVMRFRQIHAFAQTKIVAITGQKAE